MRISFSCPLKCESGKQNFAVRLSREFVNLGIKVTNKKPDINIVFVKGFKKGCKNVLRLDGIWMNTKLDYIKKNRKILNNIKKADGVVYQNLFCKKSVEKFCGKAKNSTCILNGANPKDFLIKQKNIKPFFFAACRWRPHKRLRDIIDGFLLSDLEKTYDLIIAGVPNCIIKHPSIKFLGKLSTNKTQMFTAACEGYVHLAYIDWCPNSVVEAIVAGRPVLFADSGGTGEIVKNNGIRITDKKWNFSAINHYNPPALDLNEVAVGYNDLLNIEPFKRTDLYISNIAKKYKDFFEEVVSHSD